MAKSKVVYVCDNCGQEAQKWVGRCPACGQWNTMKELRIPTSPAASVSRAVPSHRTAAEGGRRAGAVLLRDVSTEALPRIDMLDEEFNRVLGGGLVPGSLVLLGGEPGIGKSTLLLQTIVRLTGRRVLYVSGEESEQQIKLRADRLARVQDGVASPDFGSKLYLLCESSLERVFDEIENVQPELLVIDSIQTLSTEAAPDSSAGGVTQIRECTTALLKYAKESGTPVIIVGHITKDGAIAGPKVLEHIVDVVLQFEGDRHYFYRILRGQKNRFGSTNELGIYEMRGDGLRIVENPSEHLLTHGAEELSDMLLAVLEKRVGFKIGAKDVFLNLAGGLKVSDTAIDLGVIAAVLSSNVDTAIERDVCMAGEVGLSGEIRPVMRIAQRITEAEKLGFHRFILPEGNMKGIDAKKLRIELVPVRTVTEALRALFG